MNAIQEEIETLIRARYPVLYLVTSEETRAQAMVVEVASRRQKKAFEWSCNTGLVPAGTPIQSFKHRIPSTTDPMIALDVVMEQVEPAVYIFKDFHPNLSKNNPAIIRKLKEIALHLKDSHKTIVLISPSLVLPQELNKEITVLTFPLPAIPDLDLLLEEILSDVKQFKQVNVDLDAAGRQRLLQAARGLTLNEAENVFARIIVKQERLHGDDVRLVFAEKQQIIRKSGLLEYCTTDRTVEQLGGLKTLKDWLQKRSISFSTEARKFGLPAPKGILLLGLQGCGKSVTAKAISSLWQLPLLRFDVSGLFGSFAGSSEENIRRAFTVAESVAPAVLWIDEIDKAFAGSRTSTHSDGGTTARVFGTLLTWLAEKTSPVFVVATANDISHLPQELLRKGRLDDIFFIDLPSPTEREEIFRIHIAIRKRNPQDYDIPALAAASTDFSGAEIEQSIISALYDAFHEGRELSMDHLSTSIDQTVPIAKTMAEQLNGIRTWAKGHARQAS